MARIVVKFVGDVVGAFAWGAIVYAVCVWLFKVSDRTSFTIAVCLGGAALLWAFVKFGSRASRSMALSRH